ncbi:MAG TPA: serine protease, partial [Planctomycetota bacterium]|nr:serine protease [Planctomycetota bacterium]
MFRTLARSPLIFSAFLPLWAGAAVGAQQAPTEAEIVQKGKACTALVEVAEGRGGYGSAFCIDARGFYVSNAHVVPSTDATLNLILNPGEKQQKKVAAKILRRNEETDLALLKIDTDAKLPFLTLGSDEVLIETNEV